MMGQMIHNMQTQFKKGSSNTFLLFLRGVSALIFGLFFTLVFQAVYEYGNFLFWFVLLVFAGVYMRLSKNWGYAGVLAFNFVCFLIGLLLKMYILMAPG